VDLQVNGAGGVDLLAAEDPEHALARVAQTLAAHGVTTFCPTIVSAPAAVIRDRLAAYRAATPERGAEALGLHVEGPFLDPAHRGVHDPTALRDATAAEIEAWLAVGRPAMVTLAPERTGALDAIRQLARAGVVVSLGHSGADLATARVGIAAGARLGTHLLNGMPPLASRAPGLVAALLTSDKVTVGLIADGAHLHPAMVDMVVRTAGPERVALVSDALAPAGAPPGPAQLGKQGMVSDGLSVRRQTDGVLAGSALLLDGALANARDWLPWLPPARVVQMATQTPARALGPAVATRKGRLVPGYDADVAVLDASWRVIATVVRGALLPGTASVP
jgi:N-acetylglucosamine-6-phosphate deacetylase